MSGTVGNSMSETVGDDCYSEVGDDCFSEAEEVGGFEDDESESNRRRGQVDDSDDEEGEDLFDEEIIERDELEVDDEYDPEMLDDSENQPELDAAGRREAERKMRQRDRIAAMAAERGPSGGVAGNFINCKEDHNETTPFSWVG